MSEPAKGYVARGITKSFGEVQVLSGVDFAVTPGQVHGLFGHNGAGKSTLMKILAGAQPHGGGTLTIDGRPASFNTPADALRQGIACVYQELRLISDLSVTENLFLGRELVRSGLRDNRAMAARTRQLLEEYGVRVHETALLRDLSHPDKQMIEVIANLDRNASYLFLDEPTTAINGKQAEDLLTKMKEIAVARRIGVILVSHKLDEVLGVCDEATVLMAGRALFTDRVGPDTKERIIDAIVGEEHRQEAASPLARVTPVHHAPGREAKTALSVSGLTTQRLRGITLDARAGEIVGIYGLAGSGRTRFLRALYGLDRVTGGTIRTGEREYSPRDPIHAIASGIAYLTEERKKDGFVAGMSAVQNAVLSTLGRHACLGYVRHEQAHKVAHEVLQRMRIKGDVRRPVTSLSGGNQQKVLLARLIQENSPLVLLDEPTKGVDIGAKGDIYNIIRQFSGEGRCVVVVSSEEEELLEICDRIYVFRSGTCDGESLPVGGLSVGALRHAAWA